MSKKRRYQNQEPREIIARFDSKCCETGREIKKGDKCIYYPNSRQVFATDSNQAQEFGAMKFDEEVLKYNW